jgi:hypothetical protein
VISSYSSCLAMLLSCHSLKTPHSCKLVSCGLDQVSGVDVCFIHQEIWFVRSVQEQDSKRGPAVWQQHRQALVFRFQNIEVSSRAFQMTIYRNNKAAGWLGERAHGHWYSSQSHCSEQPSGVCAAHGG